MVIQLTSAEDEGRSELVFTGKVTGKVQLTSTENESRSELFFSGKVTGKVQLTSADQSWFFFLKDNKCRVASERDRMKLS